MTNKPIFQRGIGKTFTPSRTNEDQEDYIEILNQIYHEKNFSSSNKFLEFICKEAIQFIRLKEQNEGSLPSESKQNINNSGNVIAEIPVTQTQNIPMSALTTQTDTMSHSPARATEKSAAEKARDRLAKTRIKP